MFDFLFKRTPKPAAAPKLQPQPSTQTKPEITARPQATQATRDAARVQAAAIALGKDDTATVAFLLACEFADARLIAAESIHSKDAMQQVLKALRNTDRRVARLMQSRLDALQAEQQSNQLAQQCITDAHALAAQAQLTPQQVGELDRRWSALSAVGETLLDVFAATRATLADRLAQQVTLQRCVIDTQAHLQRMTGTVAHSSADELQAAWSHCEADIERYATHAEAINLPKNLLQQCRSALAAARIVVDSVRQRDVANTARVTQLQAWEAASPDTLDAAALQREWRLASMALSGDDDLSTRFSAVLELVIACKPVAIKTVAALPTEAPSKAASDAARVFEQALEHALEEGQLQQAQDADRQLRALAHASPENAAQKARLAGLRIRLSQLQGWARWGGNVSREELQKAAAALPAQHLNVIELAKKIGNLRAQWKTMDGSAGPAPQELWHAFDSACTAAYAPVAAHHQVLAEARQKNSLAAEQQIVSLEQSAQQLENDTHPNWKAIAQTCQRTQQEWQRLGPTERRDKRSLDQRFQTALQRLLQPLAQIQTTERQQREQLISTVSQLRADEHGALTTLRALQTQWQERAKAVLLDRRDEQALWLRFKAACDAVFAQRKEQASADDRQRQENLQVREALCAALEDIGTQSLEALKALLSEDATAWRAAGAVPRAAQESIENRHRQALDKIKKTIDAAQRLQIQAQQQTVFARLQVCQRLDTLLATDADPSSDQIDEVCAAWQALQPSTTMKVTALDTILAHRYDHALQAHRTGNAAYRQRINANTEALHGELMRLEIDLSLASPPEHARERLKLQVDVLQSALRDGPRTDDNAARLAKLCGLPAIVDAANAARIEQIVLRLLANDTDHTKN